MATTLAHRLPDRLRAGLNDFRLLEPAGICLVRGFRVDDAGIGPTPGHWRDVVDPSPALEEEIACFLCASLLGDPFAWATQQDGRIVHDVLPIRGHEREQLGSGSETVLTWHNEDAFHPYRADYVVLMCLRNPDRVETTYASMACAQLDDECVRVLMQPRFLIWPDESHQRRHGAAVGGSAEVARRYDRIARMSDQPDPVAVLFGDPCRPYVRADPYFMPPPPNAEAAGALAGLVVALDAALSGLTMEPGDICLLDNYRVVHGRRAFRARYDGTDRWLKRLNVARNLRLSRDARTAPWARVIV